MTRESIQEIAMRNILGRLVTKDIQNPGDPVTHAQIDNLSHQLGEMQHSVNESLKSPVQKEEPSQS